MLSRQTWIWWQAIRPKTLTVSLAPVLLGLSLALEKKNFDFLKAFLTLICVLTLQVLANLVNDLKDGLSGVDNTQRLGPARMFAQGLLSLEQLKKAIQVLALACLLIGGFLSWQTGPELFLIGLLALACAYLYTAGPLPLSHIALGEISAFFFFGPVAVLGSYYIQTHELSETALLLSCGPGFLAAALMAVNNIRDRQSDQEQHKMTLAVCLGDRVTRILACLFLFLGCVLPVYFSYRQNPGLTLWPCLICPLFFWKEWRILCFEAASQRFNSVLAATAKLCFLSTLALIWGRQL